MFTDINATYLSSAILTFVWSLFQFLAFIYFYYYYLLMINIGNPEYHWICLQIYIIWVYEFLRSNNILKCIPNFVGNIMWHLCAQMYFQPSIWYSLVKNLLPNSIKQSIVLKSSCTLYLKLLWCCFCDFLLLQSLD